MNWLAENYQYLILAIGSGIATAAIIVKMTPSKKDDAVVEKIENVYKKVEELLVKNKEELLKKKEEDKKPE